MHALTDLYLRLQRVYREKAESDIIKLESIVNSILVTVGRSGQVQGQGQGQGNGSSYQPQTDREASPPPSSSPKSSLKDTIRLMCKHARNLRVVRWPTIASEASGGGGAITSSLSKSLSLGGETGDPRQQAASFYVLFKAVDRFYGAHGRYPGSHHPQGHHPQGQGAKSSDDCIEAVREEDVPMLKSFATSVLLDMGVVPGSAVGGGGGGGIISDDLYMEMCRFGAGEMHVVASIVGGMASQEAIKIITRQFTPAHGTLIYNGIECTTTIFG